MGRFLSKRWPAQGRAPLRFLLHRSRPEWLQGADAEVRLVDLGDLQGLRVALNGTTCLINLLRPDGSGWLRSVMQDLVPMLGRTSVSRYLHASSIDVYGGAGAPYVTEATIPEPSTPYEREHFEMEKIVECAPFETCIIRVGAVFGRGGRNVIGLVPEVQNAPLWKLIARRALYGRRRMHLVSVENMADAIGAIAASTSGTLVRRVLVTDDEAPENNFAFLQETMAEVFGRPSLNWVPEMPGFALRAALLARRINTNPTRRFSNERLVEIGFRPEQPFAARLVRYLTFLKDTRGLAAE